MSTNVITGISRHSIFFELWRPKTFEPTICLSRDQVVLTQADKTNRIVHRNFFKDLKKSVIKLLEIKVIYNRDIDNCSGATLSVLQVC